MSLVNLVWLLSSWYEIRSPVRSVYIANTRTEFRDPKTFKSLSDMGIPRSARSRRELLSTRFNPGTRVPAHLQIKRFSVYIGNNRSRSIWFSKTINVDNYYYKHKIQYYSVFSIIIFYLYRSDFNLFLPVAKYLLIKFHRRYIVISWNWEILLIETTNVIAKVRGRFSLEIKMTYYR